MVSLRIVFLGLTLSSSWGNGHATTYRGLVRELVRRGHDVLFLERDVPWYAANRDLPDPSTQGYGRFALYADRDDLRARFTGEVEAADFVIVGSYVPEGVEVGAWAIKVARSPVAFYDIDTPVTLAKLERGDMEYVSRDLIPRYRAYFSFTGGPTLRRLEQEFGSPCALPLYCAVDPELYLPEPQAVSNGTWDLGYMGTYSDDRQPTIERLLIEPARALPDRRFVVAGPQYPPEIVWSANVERIEHLPPSEHRAFYNRQRFTLNVTRGDMRRAGWSPSVRLFEAAACGIPIISDEWEGLDDFFQPGTEILTARDAAEVTRILRDLGEPERVAIGTKARARVLAAHTAAHRAEELEAAVHTLRESPRV